MTDHVPVPGLWRLGIGWKCDLCGYPVARIPAVRGEAPREAYWRHVGRGRKLGGKLAPVRPDR